MLSPLGFVIINFTFKMNIFYKFVFTDINISADSYKYCINVSVINDNIISDTDFSVEKFLMVFISLNLSLKLFWMSPIHRFHPLCTSLSFVWPGADIIMQSWLWFQPHVPRKNDYSIKNIITISSMTDIKFIIKSYRSCKIAFLIDTCYSWCL